MRIFLLLLTPLLFACQQGKVYEKHITPSSALEWYKTDTLVYHVDVADTAVLYDMIMALRYAEGFPFQQMRMELIHITPSGSQRYRLIELPVTDSSGAYRGDGLGDIWDLEETFNADVKLQERGIHTFRVVHAMPAEPVPLVMEVGFILMKSS